MLHTLNINGESLSFRELTNVSARALFRFICASNETISGIWTPEEQDLYDNGERKAHEGRSEKPYRLRQGLSFDNISQKTVDIWEPGHPKHKFEIKETFIYKTVKGKPNVIATYKRQPHLGEKIVVAADLNLNKCGTNIWHEVHEEIIRTYRKEDFSLVEWKKMRAGELGKDFILSLGSDIQRYVTKSLDPVTTMAEYEGIVCGSPDGFIEVPKNDFAHAFDFVGISRYKPKYRLMKDYLAFRAFRCTGLTPSFEQLDFFSSLT